MESEIKTEISLAEKLLNFLKKKKKIFFGFLFLILSLFASIILIEYFKNKKNEEISEKFIEAGVYLSLNDKVTSKKIYIEIIETKNKFYSLLSLNNIIDNNLIGDSNEILRLFEQLDKTKMEKEQKNLVKFKKALYLMKISNSQDAKKILQEIISDESIWKDAASELINQI